MTATIDRAAVVKNEPRVYDYREDDLRQSFYRDLALRDVYGDISALERLDRHRAEELRTNPNGVLGQGGEFTPPKWAIDMFGTQARAGRVCADLCQNFVLPPGVSAIHVPIETTGTDAQVQDAQGGAVTDMDVVTSDAGSANNAVTLAGQSDWSMQALEQTPTPGLDAIIYTDLCRAYNANLESQMLAGTGSNGQLLGLTKVAGIGSVSGASVSTTQNTSVTNLWPLIGQCAAIIGTQRQLPANVVIMSPRRYYSIASALDSSNRPLASPGQGPHPNDMPVAGNGLPVGPIIGIPCYLSGGIIKQVAATADYIVVWRSEDSLLFESAPKYAVDQAVLSGTLQVRFQLHRYVAFVNRKASAISVVTAIPQPTNF